MLRGGDPGADAVLLESDATLRSTWGAMVLAYGDSLKLRHPPADTSGRSDALGAGTPPATP
jgi:hypothetical protein